MQYVSKVWSKPDRYYSTTRSTDRAGDSTYLSWLSDSLNAAGEESEVWNSHKAPAGAGSHPVIENEGVTSNCQSKDFVAFNSNRTVLKNKTNKTG